jgi:hypothetical protein
MSDRTPGGQSLSGGDESALETMNLKTGRDRINKIYKIDRKQLGHE